MIAGPSEQRNPYKDSPPRPWGRWRFTALDGAIVEVELLADTGNPCAVIISQATMARLKLRAAPGFHSNFGPLEGGWLRLCMPELGLDQELLGYGSDTCKEHEGEQLGFRGPCRIAPAAAGGIRRQCRLVLASFRARLALRRCRVV